MDNIVHINGLSILISYDANDNRAVIYNHTAHTRIGSFEFLLRTENERFPLGHPYLMLIGMNLDQKFTKKGIGREVLKHVKNNTGYSICEGKGIKSNITDDTLPFIDKMRNEGLIESRCVY